jgi:hypothetical protein
MAPAFVDVGLETFRHSRLLSIFGDVAQGIPAAPQLQA